MFLSASQRAMLADRSLPASDEVEEGDYLLRAPANPVYRGLKLKLFINLVVEGPLFRLFRGNIAKRLGVPQVLSEVDIPEAPMFVPEHWPLPVDVAGTVSVPASASHKERLQAAIDVIPNFLESSAAGRSPHRPGLREYHRAYTKGTCTPWDVASRIVKFLKSKPTYIFISWSGDDILRQAQESTQRYKEGRQLSVLDGVPFTIKDSIDAMPYETTGGTQHLHSWRKPKVDSPCVATLKSLGAMLIGKANMHELGMGITGINTYTGTPISPWRAGHCCGGSSSGSAAAVAYGLCPIAVGVDGGGSTRIPASLCGLVGLLPTTQRVGKQGHPTSFTIARIGPIATYVEDALILHTLISEAGSAGGIPPLISLPESLYTGESSDRPLAGLKMGIYWQWFTDADDDVVEACRQAVTRLESLGVVRVAINIPDLELMRVAHACTIASEQCESTNTPYVSKKWRRQMNNDVRMGLAMARTFTSRDYIHAQRVRRRMNTHFKKAMANIDMIVTPTVPVTAPRIHPTALKSNVIDSEQVFTVMRFMLGPNFLGLPAISVPVGRDSDGLPIGLQLIGKHWCEPLLFKVASALERQTREYTAVPGSAINPLTAD